VADITWTHVTNHYASLVAPAVGTDAQTDILAYVNDEALDASVFGGEDATTYKLARIYLAAHMGELLRRNAATAGAVGAATSKTITATELSVTYGTGANAGGGTNVLLTTPGGTAYLALVRSSPRARLFARSC
jgi:hypothetical protein